MTVTLSGRGWAYIGAALGGSVSIAANIAHSYVPPAGAAEGWSPNAGAVIGAVFWPVALFVATEILARVAWPSGRTWQALRWGGLIPVAAVAALVSYRHLSGLLGYYGEEPIVRILGPLAVDGLMVMATGALLATSRPQHLTTTLPVMAVTPAPTTPAVPAPHPAAPTSANTNPSNPTPEPAPTPDPAPTVSIPTPATVAARVTPSPTTIPLRSPATRPASAGTAKPRPRTPEPTTAAEALAAPATDTSVSAPEPAQPSMPMTVDPGLLRRAEQTARQYRTEHGTPITPGQLAVRLKVTSEQATQALAVLDLGLNGPTQPIPTANGHRTKVTR